MFLARESANIEKLRTTLFVCSKQIIVGCAKFLSYTRYIPVIFIFKCWSRREYGGYCLLVGWTQTAFTEVCCTISLEGIPACIVSQLTRGHSRTLSEKTYSLLEMTDDLRWGGTRPQAKTRVLVVVGNLFTVSC